MATRLPLQTIFATGATLYALIHNPNGQVWNTTLNAGAGGWENYNSAHWAQYAVALVEQPLSGYYRAAYPAAIAAVLTSEAFYQQAGGGPATSDAPTAAIGQSQGQNVAAVAGDADVPDTLQQNLSVMARGLAAGVPTVSVIPTNLANAQANAFAGRSVVFTSGPAFECAGRIVGYNPVNGVLTLAAPLPVAPAAGDKFVIV